MLWTVWLVCWLSATVLLLAAPYLWPSRKRRMVDNLPGPTQLPLLGTVYLVAFLSRRERQRVFRKLTLRFWPIFRTWNALEAVVHIVKAEHFEKVMTSSDLLEKTDYYKMMQPWLGEGLLTSKGTKWHTHRKIITPTFHFKILENFIDVFAEKGKIMVNKLKQAAGGEFIDLYPYITRCALDIICETAMGTNIQAQQQTESEYVSAVYSISGLTMRRVFRPWLHFDFVFGLSPTGRKYYKDLSVIHGFTKKVINERQNQRQRMGEGVFSSQVDDLGRKRRLAFLDLLLSLSEDGYRLSDQELQEEVDTFMFEGHDTTSVSISWTLILLGQHPDVQEKVYEELNDIFGGSDRQPTMQDLQNMKYLEMVIKESLRLYPSVPFIGRKVNRDTEIGGYTIPAGTNVMMHIIDCHRDPDVWPDPERFDPDNFLPDRIQGRHPFAYVPFSGGSRNCIGQRFALLEEKTLLSYIIRNFKVEAAPCMAEMAMVTELVLRPMDGVIVKLTSRPTPHSTTSTRQ